MRIENSSVFLSSRHIASKSYVKQESLAAWVGENRTDLKENAHTVYPPSNMPLDQIELSEEAKALLNQGQRLDGAGPVDSEVFYEISEKDKQKIELLQRMLELLTGKKIKFYVLERLKLKKNVEPGELQKIMISQGQKNQGWGLEYSRQESYSEREQLSFTAQGMIKTADGKEIQFSIRLGMSREFASTRNIHIRAGDAALIDPLVINFNGKASELTSKKFEFDLDSDGLLEQIAFVSPDSGFLALDRNGDGIINNGSELFGPNGISGFEELSLYDEDGNQWIDENDPIYERLRIWTKDPEGRDVLFALGQKGIGAIYLGNISTPFAVKDQENALRGVVKSSSIYVHEDGSIGTVQQIDLAV
ncbi:MAG: hypothetical protein K6U74_19120 [Firmicutes bacterium]|nr:hypothetical protein [Bacillota bacterium]